MLEVSEGMERPHEHASRVFSCDILRGSSALSSVIVPHWRKVPVSAQLHGELYRGSWAPSVAESQILLVAAGRLNMGWDLLCVWMAWEQEGPEGYGKVWVLLLTVTAEQEHSCPVVLSASLKKQLPTEFWSLWFPCQQILLIVTFSRVSSVLGRTLSDLKGSEKGKKKPSQTNLLLQPSNHVWGPAWPSLQHWGVGENQHL